MKSTLTERLQALRGATAGTLGLLAVSALLLAAGATGVARAADPPYVSDDYVAELALPTLGVALTENGEPAGDALLASIGGGEPMRPGVRYDEALAVTNTGDVDAFVRVTVRRYWTGEDGAKETALAPGLIGLEIPEGSGWVEDAGSATAERTVLYYTRALAAGDSSPSFIDALTIDASLARRVTQTEEAGVVTTTFDYDGVSFNVEVAVDAVQTHSGGAAILSAWGREVAVSGDTISLMD